MASLKSIILLLLSFVFSLSSTWIGSKAASPGDINWWCNQTPYPDPCKYFMNNMNHSPRPRWRHAVPKDKADFRKMTIKLAMETAMNAEFHTKTLGSKCRNDKEKAAWVVCVKLYKSTILQLNRTLDSDINCTDLDKQTWLSTALTNLDTCLTGFVEFGINLSDLSDLMMSQNINVSQLISNSLALRMKGSDFTDTQSYQKGECDDFPTWVSPGNRKLLQQNFIRPNLVVAKDGSGNYRTIQAALDAAANTRSSGTERFVIYIKSGIYEENIEISDNKLTNLMLVGDGMRYTVITGSRSIMDGITTFETSTFGVTSNEFIAREITFRNTAGPEKYQAVALRSGSDFSVFYRCGFEGYQDTLYVHSERQFYRECYIYGTVDFIFGMGAAVLQNCMILARRPMENQKITITAQGRVEPSQSSGISIQYSRVMASEDLWPVLGSFKTYLGRPWKNYSRTVFLKSNLDFLVDPAGWLEWDGTFALDTLYYGEYGNVGPGSSTANRVKWRGYRVITNPVEASRFSVANFIAGRCWLPATNVPFDPAI